MKGPLALATLLVTLLYQAGVSPALDLDFGQATIHIPEMHDSTPYLWQVNKDPATYRAEITGLPEQNAYLLTVSPSPAQDEAAIDLFLTDKRLKAFSHPALKRLDSGGYLFTAPLRERESYQAEIVFREGAGWVNLSRKFTATVPGALADKGGADQEGGYEVRIKQFPEKAYSKHTVTFVFEVLKEGRPVDDLEPVNGARVRVAAWRQGSWLRSAGDFVYADSQGNESALEAAVSLVFNEAGTHRIFAEYRHQGVTRWTSKEIANVWLEPEPQ